MKYLFLIKIYFSVISNAHKQLITQLLLILFVVLSFQNYAQSKIDSLENLLTTKLSKEEQIKVEIQIVNRLIQRDPKKADVYLTTLEEKLNSQSNTTSLVLFYYAKSIRSRQKRERDQAVKDVKNALIYANKDKDSIKFKAKLYNSLGAIADDDKNYKESIKNHLIALEYAKKTKIPKKIATVLAGLGRVYLGIPETKIAKEYYEKAIAIKLENKQFDYSLAIYYNNLSICFDNEKKYDKSLLYLDKSIALKKKNSTPFKLISAYNNKAFTLSLLKRYKKAEIFVRKSIKIADSLHLENETIYPYSTLSEILLDQNKIKEGELWMEKSITLSKKYDDLSLVEKNLDLLYKVNYEKGNYKKALNYNKRRNVVMDSIRSKRKKNEENKLAIEYQTKKKNAAIEKLSQENKIKEVELKKSKQLQLALLVTALLAIAILALLWSRYKNKRKTDELLKKAMESNFERKLADSELQALRAQMNPHFLFNCLNSINSFIIKNDQEQASEYLTKFSKLIRLVLSNSKLSKVTLANELEALKLYIEMEALRFNDKFEYKIIVDNEIEKDYIEIPPLLMQPYVENSIWHGLMHKTDALGKLLIHVKLENNNLICIIEDNGIGREAALKRKSKSAEKRKSFGMNITKERLKYINHKSKETTFVNIEDLVDQNKKSLGTRVLIKIGL